MQGDESRFQTQRRGSESETRPWPYTRRQLTTSDLALDGGFDRRRTLGRLLRWQRRRGRHPRTRGNQTQISVYSFPSPCRGGYPRKVTIGSMPSSIDFELCTVF